LSTHHWPIFGSFLPANPYATARPPIRLTDHHSTVVVLVNPEPIGQIVKRHQHKRIIAPHQRRVAHPGPHRPTLTMAQLHHQIRDPSTPESVASPAGTGWKISGNADPANPSSS